MEDEMWDGQFPLACHKMPTRIPVIRTTKQRPVIYENIWM